MCVLGWVSSTRHDSLLLNRAEVQLKSCWLLPKHVCHCCTLTVSMPCRLLIVLDHSWQNFDQKLWASEERDHTWCLSGPGLPHAVWSFLSLFICTGDDFIFLYSWVVPCTVSVPTRLLPLLPHLGCWQFLAVLKREGCSEHASMPEQHLWSRSSTLWACAKECSSWAIAKLTVSFLITLSAFL